MSQATEVNWESPEARAFLEKLKSDRTFRDSLERKADTEAFKEEFDTERTTPLKCPACSGNVGPSGYPSGGALWIHKSDKSLFTCRKCRLTFKIECKTISNEELIIEIKEARKKNG